MLYPVGSNAAYSSAAVYPAGATTASQPQTAYPASAQQPGFDLGRPQGLGQLIVGMLGIMQLMIGALLGRQAPQAQPPVNFNDNNSIQRKIRSLIPANDPAGQQALQLLDASRSLEPESSSFQLVQARIAALLEGRIPDRDLQQIFILNAVSGMNDLKTSLNIVDSHILPGSPEALQLDARQNGIEQIRQSLITRHDSIDLVRDEPNGVLISQLSTQLLNLEPESPEAQQLLARIGALFSNPASARRFAGNIQKQSLLSTQASLYTILSNLDPESPEAQQLRARIAAVDATIAGL